MIPLIQAFLSDKTMTKNKLLPLLLLPPLFTIFWFWIQQTNTVVFTYQELQSLQEPLLPLLNVIASGEGDYNSVNRGYAGDSKSDWPQTNLGKAISEMTVGELRAHQGGNNPSCWYKDIRGQADLYAVGRYQLIPCTLQLATMKIQNLDINALYDQEMQDTLGVYLLLVKRPKIREYFVGFRSNHQQAGQELAREFASVPAQFSNGSCERGQSYYCGKNGNAAHIAIKDIDDAMKQVREKIQEDGSLIQLLDEKENLQTKIQRWWKLLTQGRK